MSSSDGPGDVILREGDNQYEALRHDYLQGLWENFCFTGNARMLATFVSEGGDQEKYGLLNEVAARLDGTKKMGSNRGGPKDVPNLTLYLDVCNQMVSEASKNPTKKINVSATLRHVCSIWKPDAGADYDIKAGYTRAVDTASKRFNKGKRLFKKQFGRPWIEHES